MLYLLHSALSWFVLVFLFFLYFFTPSRITPLHFRLVDFLIICLNKKNTCHPTEWSQVEVNYQRMQIVTAVFSSLSVPPNWAGTPVMSRRICSLALVVCSFLFVVFFCSLCTKNWSINYSYIVFTGICRQRNIGKSGCSQLHHCLPVLLHSWDSVMCFWLAFSMLCLTSTIYLIHLVLLGVQQFSKNSFISYFVLFVFFLTGDK